MKTTKKGFTLIELIVVIAIIGVLAAILVPSMLGYVKKSKIQGANSTASTLGKAVNSAATELDEEDDFFADGFIEFNKTEGGVSGETEAEEAIQPFFSDIEDIDACVGIKEGQCVVAAVRSGKYYGTWPTYYTAKNWGGKGEDGVEIPGSAKEACEAVNTAKELGVGE